jgi:hypothetical protein
MAMWRGSLDVVSGMWELLYHMGAGVAICGISPGMIGWRGLNSLRNEAIFYALTGRNDRGKAL